MVKSVVLPIFAVVVVLLAIQTPINAYGVVRIEKNYDGAAFANAINSKVQAWNTFVNSFLQAKYSYNTAPVSAAGSGSTSGSTSGTTTSTVNVVPFYKKIVYVNSGVAAPASSSGQVAARVDAVEDNEVVSSTAASVAPVAGNAIITVNKSFLGVPAVSVSSAPVASASNTVAVSSSVPSSVAYTYRKEVVPIN